MIQIIYTCWQKPRITMKLNHTSMMDNSGKALGEMLSCELRSHLNSLWQRKLGASKRTIEEFYFFYDICDEKGTQYAFGNTQRIQFGKEFKEEIRSFPVAYHKYIVSISDAGTKYELGNGKQLTPQQYSIKFSLRYEDMVTHTAKFIVNKNSPYIVVTKE